jgi:hypothetical protein
LPIGFFGKSGVYLLEKNAVTVEWHYSRGRKPPVLNFDVPEFLNYKAACVSRREKEVEAIVRLHRQNKRPVGNKTKLAWSKSAYIESV